MATAATSGAVLLLLGETIPDLPDIRVGSFVTADEAEDCGYSVCIEGGWMIWNDNADWFVVRHDDPLGWFPLPDISGARGMRTISAAVIDQ